MGEIIAVLREKGIEDKTLIVLTSDNGPVLDDGYDDHAVELAGDHRPGGPFRGGKYSAFEAGSAVPFIVSWPGRIAGGQESDALLALTDGVASMASLVGVSLPEGAAPDSRNSLATWLGRSKESCPYVVSMAANRSLTLRTKRWKYMEPSDGKPIIPWGPKIETGYLKTPQLFDIKKDIGETKDVSRKKPRVLLRLQHVLKKVKEQCGERLF